MGRRWVGCGLAVAIFFAVVIVLLVLRAIKLQFTF